MKRANVVLACLLVLALVIGSLAGTALACSCSGGCYDDCGKSGDNCCSCGFSHSECKKYSGGCSHTYSASTVNCTGSTVYSKAYAACCDS